jgi:hypothetical protein
MTPLHWYQFSVSLRLYAALTKVPEQLKGRNYLFWLMVLQVSVLHAEEGMAEQSSSHHGSLETGRRIPVLVGFLLPPLFTPSRLLP